MRGEYLNYLRVREWQDVVRQLERASKDLGLALASPHVNPDGIHRSLLAGLLSHIGLRDLQKKDYLGARQTRFVIFPGSALAAKKDGRGQPDAIMSAELVETSRLFARMNGKIDPAWAEPIAGDLLKRSYSGAALGTQAGCGDRLRARDPVRRADRRAAQGAVLAGGPALRA